MKKKPLIPVANSLFVALARTTGPLLFQISSTLAADKPLIVAVSLDIPPYVMEDATKGVEVDLIRRALPDQILKLIQLDYSALEPAVSDKKADVAMSVREHREGEFYSADYIGFANSAISKKADKLKITNVADLKGHPILTWQDAWTELGDAFKAQYAPGSAERTHNIEVANQAEQVRRFWEGNGKVIVIDRSIFDYFSQQQGHSLVAVEYHDLFPQVTTFKVGFANATVRDEFNAQLKKLCQSGQYSRLLDRYHVPDTADVCVDLTRSKATPARQ
jgi:polar amino acid transport system substrate-binding protein